MNIEKKQNGTNYTLNISGRLDITTVPQMEAEIAMCLKDATVLTLDFEKLDYISFAGLRVLLSAQKTMNKQGKMTLKNVNGSVSEVFEVTGFSDGCHLCKLVCPEGAIGIVNKRINNSQTKH